MESRDLVTAFLMDRDVPCPACGYNLRGAAGIGCPECGQAIEIGVLAADPLRRWRRLVVIALAALVADSALTVLSDIYFLLVVLQNAPGGMGAPFLWREGITFVTALIVLVISVRRLLQLWLCPVGMEQDRWRAAMRSAILLTVIASFATVLVRLSYFVQIFF
jgi:hypothetical protein